MTTTFTIGANAGNYDLDIPGTDLDSLFDINFRAPVLLKPSSVTDGHITGSIEIETHDDDADSVTFNGVFNQKGLKNADVVAAVEHITSITVTEDNDVSFTIGGLDLTGADLKSDDAFQAFLNGESYKLIGNDGENVLTGGVKDDILIGNGGADHLNGGAGDDQLTGGAGADVLAGGANDDTYFIGAGDKIIESKGNAGGFDTVVSSTNAELTKFAYVEALTLTGKSDIDGTGNSGDNVLTGNGGDNTLDGGKGFDKMIGGAGDDTYVVDSLKDTVVETGKGDHDTINATVNIDLSKLATIEDVFLFGTGDLNASGNGANNTLVGNDGDNTLWGAGGNDKLTGGDGSDTFEFAKGDKFDTITDFNAKKGADHDFIDLSDFGKKLSFKSIEIEKIGKTDVEIDFGRGDTLHIHFENSTNKDLDVSDFHF